MQPFELFAAMFELYNLVSIIQSDRPELGSIQERIALLGSDLSKFFKEIPMSKRTHGDIDGDAGEHVYHDRQVVDAFTRAGYTLESNEEDEDGWAPLIQVNQSSTLFVNLN
jgi:hypothetical protein